MRTWFRGGSVCVAFVLAGFQVAIGSMIMQVEPGGMRRHFRDLSGFVKDAETMAAVSAVRVEIVDGANAGRSSTTGTDGVYLFFDLEPGTFIVRFIKAGYATAERTFSLPGDRFNSLSVNLTT